MPGLCVRAHCGKRKQPGSTQLGFGVLWPGEAQNPQKESQEAALLKSLFPHGTKTFWGCEFS